MSRTQIMSAPPAFPPGKETDKAYWAARLLKYFSVWNPTQATPEHVNTVLVKFEKAGYPKMWDLLLTKYGPEPMEETPAFPVGPGPPIPVASAVPMAANAVLRMDLCWDIEGATKVDLDASCSVFDSMGLMLDCCYFNNVMAFEGAVVHSGDAKDGGVDESITIYLARIPPYAYGIVLAVHAYQKGDFGKCESASVAVHHGGAAPSVKALGTMGAATSVVVLVMRRSAVTDTWDLDLCCDALAGTPRTPLDCLPHFLTLLRVPMEMQKELSEKQPVLHMKKGDSVKLPVNLSHITVGLGWDTKLYVDASAIFLRPDSSEYGVLMWSNRGQHPEIKRCAELSPDSMGEGAGDDVTLTLTMAMVPAEVTHVFIVINVWNGGSFANVEGEFCRLVDTTGGQNKEICRCDGMDSGDMNGYVFACFHRDKCAHAVGQGLTWWHYSIIGEHAMGNEAPALVDECQRWLKTGSCAGMPVPPSPWTGSCVVCGHALTACVVTACVVCGRSDRKGESRRSGFKCKECVGKKSSARLKAMSAANK